jgi:hypothetical protein
MIWSGARAQDCLKFEARNSSLAILSAGSGY